MADEIKIGTEEGTDNKKIDNIQKRKRIQRIKTAIIITIFILFLLPTILCIIFGIRLIRLERRIDDFFSTYSIDIGEKNKTSINGKLSYAASDKLVIQDDLDNPEDDIQLDDTTSDDTDVDASGSLEASTDKVVDTANDTTDTDDTAAENNIDASNGVTMEDAIDDTADGTNDGTNGDTMSNTGEDISDENIDNQENISEDNSSDGQDGSDNQKATDIIENTPANGGVNAGVSTVNVTEGATSDTLSQNTASNTTERYRDPNGKYYNKKVYLTFDDGPSKNTDKILDLLAEYDVKATFFVVGHDDEKSKERYKRIVDEGHVLAIHSYSHKYSYIYDSLENFDKDFTKLWNLLYDTTGYTPSLYRFPGGSLGMLSKSKMKEYVKYLNEKGMTYFDWNVVNGDAEGIDYTEKQMINNVLNGVAQKKTSIVLMHDGEGKDKTVATLPKILDALVSGGAELLPLDETAPLIQQIKASSLN